MSQPAPLRSISVMFPESMYCCACQAETRGPLVLLQREHGGFDGMCEECSIHLVRTARLGFQLLDSTAARWGWLED